ncbi:hypothetical protein HZB60_07120 [candidate division KSB1 bacterium]|nr:hypothetical protein [candidate division KSB1 bacterium]
MECGTAKSAFRRLGLALVVSLIATTPMLAAPALPKVDHYDWQIRVDYDEEAIASGCRLTVRNVTAQPLDHVPLILYRLLTVDSVSTFAGRALAFEQSVRAFDDGARMQANFVDVRLPAPLAVEDTISLGVSYRGYLAGYRETGMLYVQDHVDPAFTILRMDCHAYPAIGTTSDSLNRMVGLPEYSYRIRVNVPDTLFAANVGELVSSVSEGGRLTVEYRSSRPAWRMDVCVANYTVIERGPNRIYCFAQDSAGGQGIAGAMERCLDLYSRWFGPLTDFRGFTVLEIPEGYGSQADVTGILQTATAFHDSASWHELYHELSHQWNVREADEPRCRWQEGLATFLETLAADCLDGTHQLADRSDWMREWLRGRFAADSSILELPPASYGSRGVTGYSYSVGMLSSNILWQSVGHSTFCRIIGAAYRSPEARGLDLKAYESLAAKIGGARVHAYFRDWFFTPRGVQYLNSPQSLAQIAARYRR